MNEYLEFLENKKVTHRHTGFDAGFNSKNLFKFQNYVVNKGLSAGK